MNKYTPILLSLQAMLLFAQTGVPLLPDLSDGVKAGLIFGCGLVLAGLSPLLVSASNTVRKTLGIQPRTVTRTK